MGGEVAVWIGTDCLAFHNDSRVAIGPLHQVDLYARVNVISNRNVLLRRIAKICIPLLNQAQLGGDTELLQGVRQRDKYCIAFWLLHLSQRFAIQRNHNRGLAVYKNLAVAIENAPARSLLMNDPNPIRYRGCFEGLSVNSLQEPESHEQCQEQRDGNDSDSTQADVR
ncbi:unannotated protein [freshwater metagenome]|uniref:Unannotated protein n=1 Tax=freshwater metagenome TaxID=449393 RepID=A0A6J6P2Q7_9ZZZZ